MKKQRFCIVPFQNPGGTTAYRVQGTKPDGKRIRENYETEADALTRQQNLMREAMNVAPLPAITTRLTSDQAQEAEECYRRLLTKNMALAFCVEYTLANYKSSRRHSTVADAFKLFIGDKEASNLRPASVRTLKVRLKALVTRHGGDQVDQVGADIVRPFIFREGSSKVNQESDYRAFSNFFNWCKVQGFISVSPLDTIAKIKLDRIEPEVLPLTDARLLLSAAQAHKGGKLVPYVALALFCAIRPTEIARLTWDDVDLDAKTVTIGSTIAKMRGRRIVEIPDNAMAFLLEHVTQRTPFVAANWRKDMDVVKAMAGYGGNEDQDQDAPKLKPWPMDVLRHTGISYHLAKHQHEGKTAAWAGNSPDIVQKHYKGLVKPRDVAAFWAIMPGDGVVVQMPKTGTEG